MSLSEWISYKTYVTSNSQHTTSTVIEALQPQNSGLRDSGIKGTTHPYKCVCCLQFWLRSSSGCRRHHLGSSRRRGCFLQHREIINQDLETVQRGESIQTEQSLTLPFKTSRWSHNDITLSDQGWNSHGAHGLSPEVALVTKHRRTHQGLTSPSYGPNAYVGMCPVSCGTCVACDGPTCRAGPVSASSGDRFCHTAGHFHGDSTDQSCSSTDVLRIL